MKHLIAAVIGLLIASSASAQVVGRVAVGEMDRKWCLRSWDGATVHYWSGAIWTECRPQDELEGRHECVQPVWAYASIPGRKGLRDRGFWIWKGERPSECATPLFEAEDAE